MGNWEERVRQLLKLDMVSRKLFVTSIRRVEVGERDPETGRQAIHIQWKF